MHMVRLGVQGVELLETGRITLPVSEPWLSWLRDLRRGRHTMDEALAAADALEADIERLLDTSTLPERPSYEAADGWLIHAYRSTWDAGLASP
jgi:uncharacterized protein